MVQTEKAVEFTIRGRIDIIANILDEARNGAKKTRIMYACNLSFRQLRVYLNFLLKKGLLTLIVSAEDEKNRVFKVTKKGLDFLEAYRNLQAVIS
ncbi:MAG: winged helix-turn-helix domain-containing protein [Candidatus Bathyarchaeia archaeon]